MRLQVPEDDFCFNRRGLFARERQQPEIGVTGCVGGRHVLGCGLGRSRHTPLDLSGLWLTTALHCEQCRVISLGAHARFSGDHESRLCVFYYHVTESNSDQIKRPDIPPRSDLVRFSAMVACVDSRLPRSMCALRSHDFHVPRSLLLCALSLWLTLSAAQALDPNNRLTQYGHVTWRIQDGFISAAPTAITQTTDGYLWIGTEDGLWRFDGARFVAWNPPAGQQYPNGSAVITSLYAAKDGSL